LLEDPDDEVLDQLEIELVPTWVRLEAPHSDAVARPGTVRDLELSGTGLDGQGLFLTGAWLETHRRTGALPKHVIDTEFGPRGPQPPHAEHKHPPPEDQEPVLGRRCRAPDPRRQELPVRLADGAHRHARTEQMTLTSRRGLAMAQTGNVRGPLAP